MRRCAGTLGDVGFLGAGSSRRLRRYRCHRKRRASTIGPSSGATVSGTSVRDPNPLWSDFPETC
jgi:hypothetical protein